MGEHLLVLAKSVLGQFAFCDVADESDNAPTIIVNVLQADFYGEQTPVLAPVQTLKAFMVNFCYELNVSNGLDRRFNCLKVRDRHIKQFLLTIPAHSAIRVIYLHQLSLQINQPETVHCYLKNTAMERVTLPMLLVRE
ncbi:MAG: hypothetical protein WBQ23_06430 [Bacteroidota bacterium]